MAANLGTLQPSTGQLQQPQQQHQAAQPPPAQLSALEKEKIYALVIDLTISDKRENALLELSKRRESFADLAPILWHSFGTIAALLQEIVSI